MRENAASLRDVESPRRSPDAERFDPPVRRVHWVVERAQDLDAFLADARRRWGDEAGFERLWLHAGLCVNGHPLHPEQPPPGVPAGAWVAAYGFVREPDAVTLAAGAILHDDGHLVAVNKPAWLPMQGTRASQRLSLEQRLRERLAAPGLDALHRLDRQTSGVALFARDRETAAWVGRELREGRVAKRYVALVAPPPREDRFEVSGWLARIPHPSRFRFGLVPDAREGARASHTRFAVLAANAEHALLGAEPTTGRTHQIRVHAASVGSPVVGDDLYGPPFAEGEPWSASRVLLHAAALRLRRAAGGELEIEAPLPADLLRAASRLG
jgi:RluA family pseudouridine synthase